MSIANEPDRPAEASSRMLQLLNAFLTVQALHVVAALGLTSLSGTLRSDGPGSVRDWALYVGSPQTWQVWGRLRDAVMTGEPGFELAHGMPMWDYLAPASYCV